MPLARFASLSICLVLGCAGGDDGRGGGRRDGGARDGAPGGEGGVDAPPDAGMDAGDAGELPDTGPLPDGGGDPPRTCTGEVCGGGIDEDCDGIVDEDCPCEPGAIEACFRGDPRHRGFGVCRDGSMLCGDGLEFGTWGPCEGDALE